MEKVWYTNNGVKTLAYEYEYTADGQISEFTNNVSGSITTYSYDDNRRLKSYIEQNSDGEVYHNLNCSISYTGSNNYAQTQHSLTYGNGSYSAEAQVTYNFDYNDFETLLDSYSILTNTTHGEISFTYDYYDRVSNVINRQVDSNNSSNVFKNEIDYTYVTEGDSTSILVGSYSSSINDGTATTYTYTYDKNGYITKINYSDGNEVRYVYDDIGQLIREDSELFNATYVYDYDTAGNRISRKTYNLTAAGATLPSVKSTKTYSYSTSEWGDLLTSYIGTAITYDSIGNPTSYRGYNFSWTGRRLTGATKVGNVYSFTYNDEGIRTSKTKNGVTTNYYVSGSQIIAEETNNNLTVYIYDENGSPIGMQYHGASYAEDTWDVFWYEKNLQGDVVAIYDKAGTKLISYTYDAWGNWMVYPHNGGYSTAAFNNPFRYRGYYYDTDLGLYYLGSRYYDIDTGRFINADNQLSTGSDLTGMNLFAYCGNNPVNRIDPTGEAWWHWALGAAVVAVAAVATVVTCGGFAAAATAVCMVGSGVAAATTASTVAAGAFIGSATVYGMAVLSAASTSNSVQEFNDQGNWGTVAATAFGGLTGGYYGYTMSKAQTLTSTPTGKGTQNPKVKAAVQKGQAMHKQMDYGPGVLKEQTIAPGCRVDGIDFNNRIIYELKPNNPQAIARGMSQLNRYTSAASQQFGGTWTGVLKLYD